MNLKENSQELHMYIGNEEVVCGKDINIIEQLNNTNTLILNNCYPLSWEQTKDYSSNFYMPKDYSLFKLVRTFVGETLDTEDSQPILTENGQELSINSFSEVLFIGVIKRSNPIDLRPTAPHYATLQVLDMKTFLSEGELFNFVLTETTIGDAIEYVISQYSQYNFSVGNLNLGDKLNDTIGNYNCNQKTLYDVLEYFAQITQSVWTIRYVSDTNFAIDFYDLDNLPQGQDLVYDKTFCDDNSIIDINYTINTDNYRNKQIMTSDAISSNITINEQFYTLGQEYTTNEKIASIIGARLSDTFYENGSDLTFATTQDKNNGETADLYYTVGSNQFTLAEKVLPGKRLYIRYYSQIPGRQVVLNQNEIKRIDNQLNNSGIITRYENRQDANSSQELNSIGQTYIRSKGIPEITLTIKTINNDMYKVGDVIFFDINGTQGLEDLTSYYAVKKKTMQIIQNNASKTNNIFFTYELSNNYNFESKINFFDNQRAKLVGNIKEGEYINRYVETFENFNIIFDPPVINGGG